MDFFDLSRERRRDHSSPATTCIFFHGIVLFLHKRFCFFLCIEGADRLCRILERQVIFFNDHLRHQSNYRNITVPSAQGISQRLLEMISYVPLGHGSAYIKGHGRDHILRCFRGEDDPSYLRSISVNHCHLIPSAANLCNILTCSFYNLQLGLCCRLALF